MNTNLVFTRNSPLRTVLVNEATQQPLYRIETPRRITRKTTRIRKIAPETHHVAQADDALSDSGESSSSHNPVLEGDGPEETDVTTEDDEMARIHWHHFSPHRVVYNGRIVKRSQLLPKVWSGYTFTARGLNLKWKLGLLGVSAPKLVLDDGSKTVIAQFHTQNNIINRRKAYLEVTPSGMEILDDIILTLVFVEKKRRDREKRMRHSGGGGP